MDDLASRIEDLENKIADIEKPQEYEAEKSDIHESDSQNTERRKKIVKKMPSLTGLWINLTTI